jgi:hypothetical protein
MKRLQMQPGTNEPIFHDGKAYPVSNIDWTCLVPDHVADFMIADGRSGAQLIEDPEGDDVIICPYRQRAFKQED